MRSIAKPSPAKTSSFASLLKFLYIRIHFCSIYTAGLLRKSSSVIILCTSPPTQHDDTRRKNLDSEEPRPLFQPSLYSSSGIKALNEGQVQLARRSPSPNDYFMPKERYCKAKDDLLS